MRYFDSFTEFIATVQKYQKYIKGCFNCGFAWYSNEKDIRLNEEEKEEIQRCAFDLSNLSLTVQQLDYYKIEISHGLCTPCWRLKRGEKVRKEQREMGYHPCYGTADNGHCAQKACKWFNVCVVDQDQLMTWRQRVIVSRAMSVH